MTAPATSPSVSLPRVLVCDDEAAQRNILREILAGAGYPTKAAASLDEGVAIFKAARESGEPIDLVFTDLKMPTGTEGLDLLAQVKDLSPECEVVLMTAYSAVRSAVTAMKLGAFEYLEKPFDRDRLLHIAAQASEKLQLVQENRRLRELVREGWGRGKMIGRSPAMRSLVDVIARVAPTSTTCLIRGESGTGKELVARAIHTAGPRAARPFVAINCAAIPESLIESELFGHERGVFTGATSGKAGRFEDVADGTLFLDEIGSMRFELQAKLLRVIQEREFSRLGSAALLPFRGRIVAATAQDLEAAIADNRFREDLYFRLNVVPIEIAPLRERLEDIPLLVEHFVRECGERIGRRVLGVTPAVLSAFESYPWPGNVRELENTIERMMVLSDAEVLSETLLPPHIVSGESGRHSGEAGWRAGEARGAEGRGREAAPPRPGDGNAPWSEGAKNGARNGNAGDETEAADFALPPDGVVMEELEADLIRQALKRSNGRLEPAAQLLGITYKTLQYRIKKYNLRSLQESEKKGGP